MKRRWFKGDTHLHTTNSDGVLQQYELVKRCKKLGLDWIIITDHNYNTVEKSYSSDGLTVIQGQEITGENGHVNIWGKKVPVDPPYDLSNIDAYKKIMQASKENGCIVSVNHPFCSKCGFHMDMESFPMDCVEVWNTIQHSDNAKNLDWWVKKLDENIRIAAVGGSDFHKNYAGLNLLAMPCTITYAESNSPEDILSALVQGRSVVTNTPGASMIYLSIADAYPGDTVKHFNGMTGLCRVTKLLPGFTLRVYNNRGLVYEHKAKKYEKEHTAVFNVEEKGYVRAEIDFNMPSALKKLYGIVEKKFLTGGDGNVPELFWAFTNPIWVE